MAMHDEPLCCVVCGGVSTRVVWRENGYEGRACRCGTVYTAPPARDAIDPTIDSHPDSYYAAAARRRVRWIKRYRRDGRLLEIGCGEGHFLAAAQAAGYDVAGIEPEPGRARRAAERLGVHVECARLESCRLGRARFDIVYHCDLLSHFEDPVGALQKMQGLLAPHGVLAFEVGLLADISPWWYSMIGSIGYPQHRWLFSARSLEQLLARSDLEAARTACFALGPDVLVHAGARLLARRYRRLRSPARRNGPVKGGAPAVSLTRFVNRTESFWRYTAGRLAPRVGPATLFVIARPCDRGAGLHAALRAHASSGRSR
jgi:SAM-dependent methyltransferase